METRYVVSKQNYMEVKYVLYLSRLHRGQAMCWCMYMYFKEPTTCLWQGSPVEGQTYSLDCLRHIYVPSHLWLNYRRLRCKTNQTEPMHGSQVCAIQAGDLHGDQVCSILADLHGVKYVSSKKKKIFFTCFPFVTAQQAHTMKSSLTLIWIYEIDIIFKKKWWPFLWVRNWLK